MQPVPLLHDRRFTKACFDYVLGEENGHDSDPDQESNSEGGGGGGGFDHFLDEENRRDDPDQETSTAPSLGTSRRCLLAVR
jgi:hypothetical protein